MKWFKPTEKLPEVYPGYGTQVIMRLKNALGTKPETVVMCGAFLDGRFYNLEIYNDDNYDHFEKDVTDCVIEWQDLPE